MFTIGVDTNIDAPLQDVWKVLSDTSTFEAWNPVHRHVDGELELGNSITLHIDYHEGVRPIPAQVSKMNGTNEFGWSFVERSRWLYRGEHVFTLRATGNKTTRLEDREYFWGLLVPFRRRALHRRISQGMANMGHALAEYLTRLETD